VKENKKEGKSSNFGHFLMFDLEVLELITMEDVLVGNVMGSRIMQST
jgi:hypothetical protein